ncbi:MAG: hypothetical protein ACYSSI_05045 [Planctomycetota bacterium]|jgi:UDP-N-acetylglucosamine 1-carboxyvinyltransferase
MKKIKKIFIEFLLLFVSVIFLSSTTAYPFNLSSHLRVPLLLDASGIKGEISSLSEENKVYIQGGNRLKGQVGISGGKHSILNILGAALLGDTKITLRNFPDIADARNFLKLYKDMGVEIDYDKSANIVRIYPETFKRYVNTNAELTSAFRSSVMLFGSALLRNGSMKISKVGGCSLGERPLTRYFELLRDFGIEVNINEVGDVAVVVPEDLKQIRGHRLITLSQYGVNRMALAIILAAGLPGKTIIKADISGDLNDVELMDFIPKIIIELCDFIRALGVSINTDYVSKGEIIVESDGLYKIGKNPAEHTLSFDFCELTFWIAAAVITKGEIKCNVSKTISLFDTQFDKLYELLDEMGVKYEIQDGGFTLYIDGYKTNLTATTIQATGGLTDMLTVFLPLLMIANGRSKYVELSKYGDHRLEWVGQLHDLVSGLTIEKAGNSLVIDNRNNSGMLVAGELEGRDIRATAAFLIFALGAEGATAVSGINHLNRAYDGLIQKLINVGANVSIRKLSASISGFDTKASGSCL